MSSLAPARGDVFYLDLPEQGAATHVQLGDRPGVIVQSDAVSGAVQTYVIVPTTKNLKRRFLPTCVFLPKVVTGLPYDSVAMAHQIRVVDRLQLGEFKGVLTDDLLAKVDEVLRFTLGL